MTDTTNLNIEDRKGYLWISFPGLINRDNILQIHRRIESLLTEEHIRVVLDLSNIKIAGSIIINLIMDIRQILTSLKGTLQLVNLTKECLILFKSINLDKVLKIYENEDEIDSGG